MRLKTAIVTGISGIFALIAVGVIIVSRIDANGYYRRQAHPADWIE